VSVALRAITDGDLRAVSRYLHRNLNSARPQESYFLALRQPWGFRRPNNGFLLEEDGGIKGVFCGIYSERSVGGKPAALCNLTSWHVLPQFRSHSLRLALAMTSQRGFHFTNYSPNEPALKVFRTFGFKELDNRCVLIPHNPLGRAAGDIFQDLEAAEDLLGSAERKIAQDHRDAPGLLQLFAGSGARRCHLMFRLRRGRGVPFADILHVSSPKAYSGSLPSIGAGLFRRFGAVYSKVRRRLLKGSLPRFSWTREDPYVEMFRSDSLGPDDLDYLYSERVTFE